MDDFKPEASAQNWNRVPINRQRSSQIWSGVLLIAIGLFFFVDRQGWLAGWHLSVARQWPVGLILFGLGRLFVVEELAAPDGRQVQRRRLGGGVWMVLVGFLLLGHFNHVLTLSQSWPLFIVVAGLMVLLGEGQRRSRKDC